MTTTARTSLTDSRPAQDTANRFWLAVACADHVRRGRAEGFMQVCHGKRGPLARIRPDDGVVYYSPATALRGSDALRSFTAIGHAGPGAPYRADMGGGFMPFRRDVTWLPAREAPIGPLVGSLDFTADRNWGYRLRFGLVEITQADFERIGAAMAVDAA